MDALLLSHLVSSGNQTKEKFTRGNRYVENDSARNRYYYLDDVNDIENDIKDNINKRLQDSQQEPAKPINYGFPTDYATILNNLVGFVISTISAYLAWTCNSKLAFGKRLAFTILAFLFGMFYLVYAISFITTQCGSNN
jgi:hypothetical protein